MSKDIISKAKSHFAGVMSGELKSFYIEEWDTTFYYKKGTNFKSEAKVLELQNQGKTGEALVQVVINRCLNAEGKRVFTDHNKIDLMNSVDPEVLIKIVNALNSDEDEMSVDVETASKN